MNDFKKRPKAGKKHVTKVVVIVFTRIYATSEASAAGVVENQPPNKPFVARTVRTVSCDAWTTRGAGEAHDAAEPASIGEAGVISIGDRLGLFMVGEGAGGASPLVCLACASLDACAQSTFITA